MLELVALVLALLPVGPPARRDLVLENLLLRQQLAVALRGQRRPKLRPPDRCFWALIRGRWERWRHALVLVQPATVVRWHHQGWRLVWRWKSRPRPGRPRLGPDVRRLIAAMARDNPLWGAERLRGELLKLGVVVSNRSIRRYRRAGRRRPPSQTWRTFLANHAAGIWACDLFTVPTLTFRTLSVLLFISHERRELVHLNVTAHPTAGRVWQQLREATPWGRQPRHLIRDRDAVFGGDFVKRAEHLGIETLLTPFRAPKANAIAERVVRSIRNECLDHLVVLNEAHLRLVLAEFGRYYNIERPHRSLGLTPPVPIPRSRAGPVRSRPVLSGLHHVYERAA
jgi:transposase InsO family protein